MTLVSIINQILAVLTVVGQAAALFLLVGFFVPHMRVRIAAVLSRRSLLFSFAAALVAMLGSLFYSEIAGYEPCKLCWFQRILMYPMVIVLGIALYKRHVWMSLYAAVLSGLGALIAGYHYLLQIGVTTGLPCSATGYSVSCSKTFVMQFGYITIPLMAFTAFTLIFLVSMYALREIRDSGPSPSEGGEENSHSETP